MHRHTADLFKKIVEELDRNNFTIKEIIEEFCSCSEIKVLDPDIKPVRFTTKDLKVLIKLGLIEYDKTDKCYRISEKGARLYENIENIYDAEDVLSLQEFIFDNNHQE
ncbi:MAG: hypothetical protein ACP5QN_00665 [Minisyncoccia bacterium]